MTRRRLHFGSGELIILIVIGLLLLIGLTGNYEKVAKLLIGPVPGVIAVVMLIEYLLLRGADRSAIYRRELEAAHEKRRDDVLALRTIEAELVELRARLAVADPPGEADPPALRELGETVRQSVDRILPLLRARI